MSTHLTHLDEKGRAVMVDISAKTQTHRVAIAGGWISMNDETFSEIVSGDNRKGDVLGTARVAGIMAAKRCAELIPLCHPISTESIIIEFEMIPESCTIKARCTVSCIGKTGVEMEALCGVNLALLTIYDMCKALDQGMTIQGVRLLRKNGGKSGDYRRSDDPDA